jgi:iron-sulfur cluster repair protein YtfE (RIC family)
MTDDQTLEELHEHIEELTSRIQVLETAVDHWRFLYKTLDVLYQKAISRD